MFIATYIRVNQLKALVTTEGYQTFIATYIRVDQPKALVTTEGYHMIIATYICINQPKALVIIEKLSRDYRHVHSCQPAQSACYYRR